MAGESRGNASRLQFRVECRVGSAFQVFLIYWFLQRSSNSTGIHHGAELEGFSAEFRISAE